MAKQSLTKRIEELEHKLSALEKSAVISKPKSGEHRVVNFVFTKNRTWRFEYDANPKP